MSIQIFMINSLIYFAHYNKWALYAISLWLFSLQDLTLFVHHFCTWILTMKVSTFSCWGWMGSTVCPPYLVIDRCCVHPLIDGNFLYLQKNFKALVALSPKKSLGFKKRCTALQADVQTLCLLPSRIMNI